MIPSPPNPAWPLRSDAENAGQPSSFALDGITLPPGWWARPIAGAIDVASKAEPFIIKLRNCAETAVAAEQSVLALVQVLAEAGLAESLESITGLSDRYGLGLTDERDFFRVELALGSASRAADEDVLRILPSQAYIELVAAVAVDCGRETVVSHGWPILSVESRVTTVAEGAAPATAAPEAEACSLMGRSRLSRTTPPRLSR